MNYVFYVHPGAEKSLRTFLAKERWKEQYRQQRLAKRIEEMQRRWTTQ